MKKVVGLALSMVLVCLCVAGCGNKQSEYEKTMKEYATKYFELHMIGTENVYEHTVDIAALKKANELVNDGYDMTKLSACDDSSSVTIFLKEGTKEIDHYEFNMKCGEK